jgi:hypothetical protein
MVQTCLVHTVVRAVLQLINIFAINQNKILQLGRLSSYLILCLKHRVLNESL